MKRIPIIDIRSFVLLLILVLIISFVRLYS
ncbi:hypothetical protein SAMN05421668_101344 [Halolactibacillus miurensis]|jgi:hypothetical protein|uniref:Uncharacterized protein n=1 Tax=Halolactibacillus miurensis TaxID=306541 RepID=A0A1I6PCV6_9BACI|nr:hypothetical protein SAMN05421668_101344 [Halolactibacillus miurensis]